MQRQKLSEEEKKEFFDYVASYLGIPSGEDKPLPKSDKDFRRNIGVSESRILLCLDTSLKFSLNLLVQIGKTNIDFLNSSLKELNASLNQYLPGDLYSASDRMGYQLDDNLNNAREQLI